MIGVDGLDQARFGQSCDAVENVEAEILLRGADRLDRVKVGPASEDRDPAEQGLLGGREQVVAPFDRGAQGLLPGRAIASATLEPGSAHLPIVRRWQIGDEPCSQVAPSSRASGRPSRRLTIAAMAGAAASAELEVGPHGASPVEKQLDRRAAARSAAVGAWPGSGNASGSTVNSRSPASRSGARLVTRAFARGTAASNRPRNGAPSRTCSKLSSTMSRSLPARFAAMVTSSSCPATSPTPNELAIVGPTRRGSATDDKIDEGHPVGEVGEQETCRLDGESRLATAARAGQRDQAGSPYECLDRQQLIAASHKRGCVDGQVAGPAN